MESIKQMKKKTDMIGKGSCKYQSEGKKGRCEWTLSSVPWYLITGARQLNRD